MVFGGLWYRNISDAIPGCDNLVITDVLASTEYIRIVLVQIY